MADYIAVFYSGDTRGVLKAFAVKNGWEQLADFSGLEIVTRPGNTHSVKRYENQHYCCFVTGNVFIRKEISEGIIRQNKLVPDPNDEFLLPWYFEDNKDETYRDLSGDYSIILYDKREQEGSFMNSIFGMIPVYYAFEKVWVIISSKISHLTNSGLVPAEIDEVSWLEHFIFNHFPGEYTGIKNVRLLPAASVCTVKKKAAVSIKKYRETASLLSCQNRLNKHDGLVLLDETIKKVLRKIIVRAPNPAVTLTGGWDGRLVLSFLTALNADFFLYSFGAEHSADIEIPKKISADLGFRYLPVMLNEDYLKDRFIDCACRTILESDGQRSFNRAHYLYGIEKIRTSTKYLISGNCGSNILKTSKKANHLINENLLRLIYDGTLTPGLIAEIETSLKQYPFAEVSLQQKEELLSRLRNYAVCKAPRSEPNERYYGFLFDEIERKYFGVETQTYNESVLNFSFFIDADVVTALSQTDFFGVHLPFYHRDVRYKYLTTWLYANLIRKNNPALAKYPSDKGFSLDDALNPTGKLKAMYQKYFIKKIRSAAEQDSYNTNPTTAIFREFLVKQHLLDQEKYKVMMDFNRNKLADSLSWLYWQAQN